MFSKDKNIKVRYTFKHFFLVFIYDILIISLFIYFFYTLGTVKGHSYIDYTENNFFPTNNDSIYTFVDYTENSLPKNSNLQSYEESINKFLSEAFTQRNNSFLSGDVSSLYNYYRASSSNGRYSLIYEFKRIAYLRDWAIERGILFTSINSFIIINSITQKDNKFIIDVDEQCTFTYVHNKGKLKNEFSLTIPHILTLYSYSENFDDLYLIDKDYYCDVFDDGIDNYTFTLTETVLPYTKTLNSNFSTPTNLKVDDILRFEKSLFTDHKAVISGFDSNGYPLINCNSLNAVNMPFDFGWNEKNIKSSY